MNSESLKAKINNRAKKNKVMPQDLMQMYFFERLLYRISISKYKHNFILKGGLLLSALFGDERRTTQDMDTMIKGIEIENDILNPILEEIININGDDGIEFKILKSSNIRNQDKYGGIRISLLGIKEELQVNLKIDITTKDPIIPREINFKYKSMFDNSYINIMVFPKESIIAEKFQTLIEDTESDTRAKDFYDLYMLMKEDIDKENLRKAIINTFKRREKSYILKEIEERYDMISKSDILKSYWNSFKKSHIYASNISYDEIVDKIEEIVNVIIGVTV